MIIPVFERDGDDIHIRVPVKVTEAGLGARIEVPTVDGRAEVKIPQGTQNGQEASPSEKGVFNSRKNIRGDQIVEIVIQASRRARRTDQGSAQEAGGSGPLDPRAELWSKV